MHSAANKYNVTYNSADHGGFFMVITKFGILEFPFHPNGLHYLNVQPIRNLRLNNSSNEKTNNTATIDKMVFLIETMWSNYKRHSKCNIEGAIAGHLQSIIGRPQKRDFE